MEDIKNNDVVVLAHVHLKHTQVETKNAKMFMEAQSSKEVYNAFMFYQLACPTFYLILEKRSGVYSGSNCSAPVLYLLIDNARALCKLLYFTSKMILTA